MFDRIFNIAAIGLAFGAVAAMGSVGADELSCDEFAWPNYPSACLSTADGASIDDRSIRIAVGTPTSGLRKGLFREGMPLYEPAANPVAKMELKPKSDELRADVFEAPENFSRASAAPHEVTVWRAGNPTVYFVTK
jgi:hypothetical protein